MEKDLFTKGRKKLEERFNEVGFRYRREEKLYELHDIITNISYWFKKLKNGGFVFVRITDYN